jgi:hypothetical protein
MFFVCLVKDSDKRGTVAICTRPTQPCLYVLLTQTCDTSPYWSAESTIVAGSSTLGKIDREPSMPLSEKRRMKTKGKISFIRFFAYHVMEQCFELLYCIPAYGSYYYVNGNVLFVFVYYESYLSYDDWHQSMIPFITLAYYFESWEVHMPWSNCKLSDHCSRYYWTHIYAVLIQLYTLFITNNVYFVNDNIWC